MELKTRLNFNFKARIMNLKNYTSNVSAQNSINKIEKLLVGAGATNITKSYIDGKVVSMTFLIDINGNTIPFKLPAKVETVEKVLKKEVKRPRKDTFSKIAIQAEKTAWKIMSDWVEIQISIISLEQAEFIEVFLPYTYFPETNKTFFESIKEKGYKALLQ